MEIWLDTINIEAVKKAAKTGLITGVTTNPSILSKANNVPETIEALLDSQEGYVAVQVTSSDAESMIREGKAIANYSDRMIVKVPVNPEGLIALSQLGQEGIAILATGVFLPSQVIQAASLSADYIAPYFGHMHEISDSTETLKTMTKILRQFIGTKLMAAALKSVDDIITSALCEVDAVTIKEEIFFKFIEEHHLLKKFNEMFASEWKQAQGSKSIAEVLS